MEEKMEKVLKKLGYKAGMKSLMMNEPKIPGNELKSLMDPDPQSEIKVKYDFILFFAVNLDMVREYKENLSSALNPEGRLWIVYPKKTSKKYRSDLSRDILWGEFGPYGFEPVSQFAVDDDWSAMRYRPVSEIKTMKRKVYSSEEGKKRAEKENENAKS